MAATGEGRENAQTQTRFIRGFTMNAVVNEVTKEHLKADVTPFKVGDGVKVHTRVVEGGKERIQIFAGIVIALKGSGINRTFTVRRISYGEGVEKVFPVHSPLISQIEVDKESKTMRARMYYLRDLVGKKAMQVKEKRLAKGKH